MAPRHSKSSSYSQTGIVGDRAGMARVASSSAALTARGLLDNADRIAVITKFRFMGDTIVATPFLRQLREYYPKAEITLLTAPSVVTALANCPYVDYLSSIDMSRVSRLQHSRELYNRLRDGGYAASFLLNRSLHCAAISAFAGIPVRIGYVNEFRRPFLTVPVPYFFDRNEVDCHLDMLRAIGLETQELLPELWFSDPEKTESQDLLVRHGAASRPIIGVQPGANDPFIREWGAERYGQVADALIEATGGTIVLMGASPERDTANRTAAAMHGKSINLVGELGLRQALGVIGRCDLWIGNDTGLLHAAVAQGVPSVGIFGPNKVVRWGYSAPHHRSLVVFPERPARDDEGVRRCLDAISEDLVLKTAHEVMRMDDPEVEGEPHVEMESAKTRPPYFTAGLDSAFVASVPRR